jgi:hypothetical protein
VLAHSFVATILPGREEEWRRFVQEIAEERLHEYEDLRQRLGLHNESVWLARTQEAETAVVYLEAGDAERVVSTLAASEEPFDLWFKERLLKLHGLALARNLRKAAAGLLFAYRDVPADPLLAAEEGLLEPQANHEAADDTPLKGKSGMGSPECNGG